MALLGNTLPNLATECAECSGGRVSGTSSLWLRVVSVAVICSVGTNHGEFLFAQGFKNAGELNAVPPGPAPVLIDPMDGNVADINEPSDAVDEPELEDTNSTYEGLKSRGVQQLGADFEEFLGRRTRILERSRQLQQSMRQSEANWNRVKWEEARQLDLTLSAMQQTAMLDSMTNEQVAAYDGRYVAMQPSRSNRPTRPTPFQGVDAFNLERSMQTLTARIGQAQLQQLDAVSRSIVQQRIVAVQEMVSLHQRLSQWNAEYWNFSPRYWPHSDPEQKLTREEVEARLEHLQMTNSENHFARFTKGLLHARLGEHASAIREFESLVEGTTPLAGPALIAKAISMTESGKEKDAKRVVTQSAKSRIGLPIEHWLMSKFYSSQGNSGAAEKELKSLLAIPQMELLARREQVILTYLRSQGNNRLIDANLKMAKTAFELDPAPDWYAYVVYALAHNAKQNFQEAADLLREASELAEEENKELCDSILAEVENHQWVDWKKISSKE